jgi:hypothetical protein
MDPAYVFAAVVIAVAVLFIVLLIRRAVKNAPVPTPFSPDRNYWWDGAAWKPVVSGDGKWAWDGNRWQPHLPEVSTGTQQVAAALATTSPGARFGLQLIVTLVIVVVFVSLGLALGFRPSGGSITFFTLAAVAAVRLWATRKGGWGSPPK